MFYFPLHVKFADLSFGIQNPSQLTNIHKIFKTFCRLVMKAFHTPIRRWCTTETPKPQIAHIDRWSCLTFCRCIWCLPILLQKKTRPDTRQDSRGRLGRGSNAKIARNSVMWQTDRQGKVSACPRLKSSVTDGPTDQRTNRPMDRRTDGGMDGRMDGWTNRRTKPLIESLVCD